ncbi:hypothetical protein [Streptomyces sp. TN58]|uniref:hypothetical protein n=1 Tax=Streptomyces sp. TN58 TaxID=234612 RepID=UPI0009506441|nr:hypothetical protein [Streptomyces sp. TN58]APU43166.1 hypothetical protein BSL84_28700 [Streptomyces sp. TN58]
MAGSDFRPVYHPAGHDNELRVAVQDLRTGRWVAMAQLLDRTDGWGLWTQRTQVLAAVAAGSDVVQAWRSEEPRSVAASVMHTRVAVERAVRAHRARHSRTRELWQEAWAACRDTAELSPADPVPWVCLLALALLDEHRSMDEHRQQPPALMLPRGPWGILAQVDKRDPHNREAYHRMLQFVCAGTPGPLTEAANFVHWASGSAPPESALHLLPLYLSVERYRRERGQEKALDLHWVAEDAVRDADHALGTWFRYTDLRRASQLDLNHLAHALWGAHRFGAAAQVFDAIDRYWTTLPWAHRTRDPADQDLAMEVFLRARTRSLASRD